MAYNRICTYLEHFPLKLDPEPEELKPSRTVDDRGSGVLGWLDYEVFRKDHLDRKLERHHITGIAFSGAVGIGIFKTSGEIIALGGPVGALLAYIFAGLVVFSVMRCLAEMVSVRPVTAPLIDFPHTFVDEALGFTVGIMYWSVCSKKCPGRARADVRRLANCMSMVTLTIAATMLTQYWQSNFGITAATFILLLALFLMNACGVQLYGRMEWVFKWLKIALLVGSILLMILIRAGDYEISPGYKSTAFFANDKIPAIAGTGGRILAVWTCTTMAMFQFMGGEIVLVTAGEAKRPMRDLPIAARYMYLLPVSFYLIAILVLGLNINYLDPRIYHSHVTYLADSRLEGIQTAARSPFVVVIENAGIRALPGFLDACFIFSALTAATNNGNTPLAAIAISFLPGALAFLAVRAKQRAFKEVSLQLLMSREKLIHVFGRLYTGPVLCIYAAQCLAFLRFLSAIKFYKRTIDRDSPGYRKKHYRAHWQPVWAILGLVLCTLLMLFSGWAAIYDLAAKSPGVSRADSIVDLIATYLGPFVFFAILITYKLVKHTRIRSIDDMRNVWFVRDADVKQDDLTPKKTKRAERNRFYEFLSWVR
ncbi:MAG: hypothetical protein Q9166_002575 [cf. Caloplaca sp. 2 TL-2023]